LLRNKQLDERKFRRQQSFNNYVVDFYCPSEKLIVELDGDSHGDYKKIQLDIKRDIILEGLGNTVLRFENRFVFQDPEYVLQEIRRKFIDIC
jgi:very-short-patch-repair endonuclease